MPTSSENALMQVLLLRKLISEEQYQQLVQESQARTVDLFKLLAEKHWLPEEDLAKIKGEVLNIPYIDLKDKEIKPEVLNLITADIAQNYNLAPFSKEGDEIGVAMLDPQDFKAIEALDFIARQNNLRFKYHITAQHSLDEVLKQYGNLGKEVAKVLKDTDPDKLNEIEKALDVDEEDAKKVKTAPVSKMVSVILRHAIEGEASDVHIEPVPEGTRVRYRMEGELHISLVLPSGVHNSLVSRIKVLANLKLDETRRPQDGRFRMKFENREVEFRVSTLPLLNKEKVVMRILDTSKSIVDLEALGFTDRNFEVMKKHIKSPHGMYLVTGPTGSGKSTTLYVVLSRLNKEEVNIVTLEDPVEYNLPGISQAQIRPEVGLTFVSGLRSVLRQDPDIIMVGEIRDNETAELAVHAALTGHMVLSTLHTNDALGAIPRLIDMGIEDFLIASSLNVVVAQRLVRKLCEHCKQEALTSPELEKDIRAEAEKMPPQYLPKDINWQGPFKFYAGKGCSHCDNTGYAERFAIAEVLEVTNSLKQIITQGKSGELDLVRKEFEKQGMFTMKQDGIIKALRGQTSIEEVWSATKE